MKTIDKIEQYKFKSGGEYNYVIMSVRVLSWFFDENTGNEYLMAERLAGDSVDTLPVKLLYSKFGKKKLPIELKLEGLIVTIEGVMIILNNQPLLVCFKSYSIQTDPSFKRSNALVIASGFLKCDDDKLKLFQGSRFIPVEMDSYKRNEYEDYIRGNTKRQVAFCFYQNGKIMLSRLVEFNKLQLHYPD